MVRDYQSKWCGCMDTSSLKVIRRVPFTIPYVKWRHKLHGRRGNVEYIIYKYQSGYCFPAKPWELVFNKAVAVVYIATYI